MLTRRFALAGVAATLATPSVLSRAEAQLRTQVSSGPSPFEPPRQDEFQWLRPGVQSLNAVALSPQQREERAFKLLFEGGLVSPQMEAELRNKYKNEKPYEDRITLHTRSTRMSFADERFRDVIVAPNVVAVTNAPGWKGKSRRVFGWQVKDYKAGHIIKLEKPEVCGNFLLLITDFQLVCVTDKALCTPACAKLRLTQYQADKPE